MAVRDRLTRLRHSLPFAGLCLVLLAACASGHSEYYNPYEEPWWPEVNEFLSDCNQGVVSWRPGEVRYPSTFQVTMGESSTYVATLDIRNTPEAPSKEIPGPDPESEMVFVQCAVAAHLVPADDTFSVDPTDWIARTFTPSGTVDWSWSVKAEKVHDGDLSLQLMPAVTSNQQLLVVENSGSSRTDFVTHVTTQATWAQSLAQWIDDNKLPLIATAVALFGAVIWLLRRADEIRQIIRRPRAKARTPSEPDTAAQDVNSESPTGPDARPPS